MASTLDPLRVPKGTQPIPGEYYEGLSQLRTWSERNGVSTDSGDYIRLRNNVLRLCEFWREHDWETDKNRLENLREALRDHRQLVGAIRPR